MKWLGVNAVELSKYIVSKCNKDDRPITNVVLQCLLYIIQEYFLSCDMIAFFDDFEAWTFGAVIPNSYYYFCGFGAMPITNTYDIGIQHRYKGFVDLIIDTYRERNPYELFDRITKEGSAWRLIYQNGNGKGKTVPFDLIKSKAAINGLVGEDMDEGVG